MVALYVLYKISAISLKFLPYYLSIKLRLWIFRFTGPYTLSKTLKRADIPKELRIKLVTRYKEELIRVIQNLSLRKLLKNLT